MPLSAIMQKRYPACNASINGNLWAVKCIPNHNNNLCVKLQDYHRPVNPSPEKSRNQLIGTRCLLCKLGRFGVGEHNTSYEALVGFWVVDHINSKPSWSASWYLNRSGLSVAAKTFSSFFWLLTFGSIWYSNYPCLLTFTLF